MMKKKILAILTATIMIVTLSPLFAVSAFASTSHDLKVTRNGVDAIENEDYKWETGIAEGKLTILKNGLTVTGTTNDNVISTDETVSNLTLKDAVINSGDIVPLAILNTGEFTLNVIETNELSSTNNFALATVGSISIEGNGTLKLNTTAAESTVLGSWGNVSINMNGGTIEAIGKIGGIYLTGDLDIISIKKLLVRVNGNRNGAILNSNEGNPAIKSLATDLTITGSADFEEKENNIINEVDYTNNCQVVLAGTDKVAKSVLVKGTEKNNDIVVNEIKDIKINIDKEKDVPKTEDENNMMLWCLLAFASVGLIVGTVIVKRTNR